jgi:hypothetical protein
MDNLMRAQAMVLACFGLVMIAASAAVSGHTGGCDTPVGRGALVFAPLHGNMHGESLFLGKVNGQGYDTRISLVDGDPDGTPVCRLR